MSLADLTKSTSEAMKAKGTVAVSSTIGDETMTGHYDFSADPVAFSMKTEQSGATMDMRFVGGKLYVGGTAVASSLKGKSWMVLDPNDTSNPMSQSLAPLSKTLTTLSNPNELLASVGDAEAKVTAVDGTNTTYTIELTAAQVQKLTDDLTTKMLGSSPTSTASATPEPQKVIETVNGDGLPVKVVMNQPTGGATEDMVTEYSQWGASFDDLAEPPADQVISSGDLMP
ncbi:MAG: hypothetical protein ACK5MP_06335 [Nostocoides sp.]